MAGMSSSCRISCRSGSRISRSPGLSTRHDPRERRCALSSVTSFEMVDGKWTEVSYAEPASTAGAVDVGAV